MFQARTVAFCMGVAASSVLTAGCGLVPPFVPPVLPADVQFVVDNSAALTIVTDAQAAAAAAPVSSAVDLSGCWGRAYPPVEEDVSTDNALFSGQAHVIGQVFEVWHFDAAAQSVRYVLLIRDNNTGVSSLQIMSGTFALPIPGSLAVQFTKFETNNWATGAIEELPLTGSATDLPVSTVGVEQSGGRLFLVEEGQAVATTDPNEIRMLQRFTCPD